MTIACISLHFWHLAGIIGFGEEEQIFHHDFRLEVFAGEGHGFTRYQYFVELPELMQWKINLTKK